MRASMADKLYFTEKFTAWLRISSLRLIIIPLDFMNCNALSISSGVTFSLMSLFSTSYKERIEHCTTSLLSIIAMEFLLVSAKWSNQIDESMNLISIDLFYLVNL